jgi:hypothetical protein
MDRSTALAVFNALERQRTADDDPLTETKPPTFDVRLDAGSHSTREETGRTYRVRVTPAKAWTGFAEPDAWRYVLDLCDEHGLVLDVQNAGVELS